MPEGYPFGFKEEDHSDREDSFVVSQEEETTSDRFSTTNQKNIEEISHHLGIASPKCVDWLWIKLPGFFILKYLQRSQIYFLEYELFSVRVYLETHLSTKKNKKKRCCLVLPGLIQKMEKAITHYCYTCLEIKKSFKTYWFNSYLWKRKKLE